MAYSSFLVYARGDRLDRLAKRITATIEMTEGAPLTSVSPTRAVLGPMVAEALARTQPHKRLDEMLADLGAERVESLPPHAVAEVLSWREPTELAGDRVPRTRTLIVDGYDWHLVASRLVDGDGTSFATPQVAGTAALWLAKHRNALGDTYPERWMRVAAFLKLLKETARTPEGGWDTRKYGAGLLNAFAILDADLPEADTLAPDTQRHHEEQRAVRRGERPVRAAACRAARPCACRRAARLRR
ncbi:MAG: hypothetical protein HYU41_06195 [Candidatus Rokubacteria bacterium]|nr:hypothetical protein [Candidatus Rokubacteria bacterium]